MKRLLLFPILFLTINIYAQEFMGIKVDGKKSELIAKFKEKGFKVVNNAKGSLIMDGGSIGTTPIELVIIFTPKTEVAWKFAVYLPKQTEWYTLKAEYNKYKELFTSKYGEPESDYHFFSSPYYEGDGYEMSALGIEKCTYSCYWKDYYSIEISKYKQVKISYENPTNTLLNRKEKSEIETNSF